MITSAPARTHFVVGVGAAGARQNGEAVDESPAFSEGRPARRWLRLPALVAGVLLSLAALALAATRLTGDHGASDRGATPVAAAPRGAPQAEERSRTNSRRFAPPSSRESPPAAAHAAPGRPARRQRSSPPASVFVWLPVRGASHYKVEFFRGGRKVFEARTAKARLELPRRWTFRGRRFEVTPGNYRWSVQPGFGARSNARYGATIVASRWTVPA
jgi:ribosomal protein L34